MTSRERASVAAAVIFVVVLFAGGVVIGSDHGVEAPKTTTKIGKPGSPVSKSRVRVVTVQHLKGKKRSTTDTTTTTTTPAVEPTQESTTVTGQRSFIERLLGEGGIIFLQIGAVLLAAFIAAAAVQRVLVGQYGGFKAGPVEVDELADRAVVKDVAKTSSQGLTSLEAAVKAEADGLKKLSEQVTANSQSSLATDATLTEQIVFLAKRLDTLEGRVPTP